MVAAWSFFGQFRLPQVLLRLVRLTNKLRLFVHTSEINCINGLRTINIDDVVVLYASEAELYSIAIRQPGAIMERNLTIIFAAVGTIARPGS
ncbi:hypothetical protein CO660_25415 [Rhizobium sp. L9]|nr:hypothetical protein CO660_25415 [Rhizobium sp. L9]